MLCASFKPAKREMSNPSFKGSLGWHMSSFSCLDGSAYPQVKELSTNISNSEGLIATRVKCLVILHEVFMKYSRTIHEVISWRLQVKEVNRKWDLFIKNSWNDSSWSIHEETYAWIIHGFMHSPHSWKVHEEFIEFKTGQIHEVFMK